MKKSHFLQSAVLFSLALALGGCAGRALGKKSARDVILASPAAELSRNDMEVLAISSIGSSDAIVETRMNTAFRLRKQKGQWVVQEIRIGNGGWEKIDNLLRALLQIKIEETQNRLEQVAAAIDDYHRKNQKIPRFTDYISLSDSLHPAYLKTLIRDDAWNHSLSAESQGSQTVRLISSGPDGELGTKDDIELIRTYP